MELNDSVELILQRKGSQVHTVAADATVYEALQMLADRDIGALVVMQGSELAGMFSERDYVRKVILEGPFLERDARQGIDVEPGRHGDASRDGGRVHAPDDVEALPASFRSWMRNRSSVSCRLAIS